MSNNIFYSADYDNENFTGLFDRIINIKFKRRNGETFTLRSDYEPVWQGDQVYFKTCQPKPEIRVSYTQYQATLIAVDIFVTNLNIIEAVENKASTELEDAISSSKVKDRASNQDSDILTQYGNPIDSAEIEMGYRGQFHNWANEKPSKYLTSEQLYKSFLNLELPSRQIDQYELASKQQFFKAQRRCSVKITWAAHTNNPPDRVTQFHGYVGSTEAGFQPYSLPSFNSVSETGQISKDELYNDLNDSHNPISETFFKSLEGIEQGATENLDEVINTRSSVYRNLFNYGEGFTLFEAFCFHSVTRRFIRADIPVTRNKLLEKAALEYALATVHPNASLQLTNSREDIKQIIFAQEKQFAPENFKEENGLLVLVSEDKNFIKRLDNQIDEMMIQNFIGARYTIKNLPEYRKLYTSIRTVLSDYYQKGKSLSWWEAAELISLSALKTSAPSNGKTKEISKDIEGARNYILASANEEYTATDCYFSTSEWILPLQGLEKASVLKDTKGKEIFFYPPDKVTSVGFAVGTEAKKKVLKCFSGLLEIRDAYLFGTPVLCSETASKIFQDQHKGNTYIDFQFLPTLQSQIEWICETYGFNYYLFHNGGYYIYSMSENVRDTTGQKFVKNQTYSSPFKIPAIYDLTLGPIRKMRLPFISFLTPMQIVEWNATTAIGSMISFFFQPKVGRNFFMVIKNSVEFCTLSDTNMMEIDLVDAQATDRTDIPVSVVKQNNNKKEYIKVLIIPDKQLDTWQKIYNSPVGKIPVNLLNLWEENLEEDRDLHLADGRVSPLQFFTLMSLWNPSLFALSTETETGWDCDDSNKRIDKKANALYGRCRPNPKVNFPEINYCINRIEPTLQRILMKFPFMPNETDYDTIIKEKDTSYILVYHDGIWEMQLKASILFNTEVS